MARELGAVVEGEVEVEVSQDRRELTILQVEDSQLSVREEVTTHRDIQLDPQFLLEQRERINKQRASELAEVDRLLDLCREAGLLPKEEPQ